VGEDSILGTGRDPAGPAVERDGAVRCPSCGGLVAPNADWCGQCFAPLRERAPATAPPTAGKDPGRPDRGAPSVQPVVSSAARGVEVEGGRASWDCPVCGERNAIEASVCDTCQTPFSRLFEEPARRPEVEPKTAALWSLAFAGLGHWKTGLRADGVARMVLFAWTLGTVLVVLASRSGGGFGASTPLFALYLGAAVAVYALSAIDAYRIAGGLPQLVTSRVLLWTSAALVLVSIAMATLVTLPAARG